MKIITDVYPIPMQQLQLIQTHRRTSSRDCHLKAFHIVQFFFRKLDRIQIRYTLFIPITRLYPLDPIS